MIYFDCCGLNFDKFLKELKLKNIKCFEFSKKSQKEFEIAILKQDKNVFLQITKHNNIVAKQKNKTFFSKLCYGIKTNLAVFICFIVCIFSFCFFSNFVYKIEISGLQNISTQQVLQVLSENKIELGHPKWSYNFEQIQLDIKNSLEDVSLVSAAVFGNTLVINIHEKIG